MLCACFPPVKSGPLSFLLLGHFYHSSLLSDKTEEVWSYGHKLLCTHMDFAEKTGSLQCSFSESDHLARLPDLKLCNVQ